MLTLAKFPNGSSSYTDVFGGSVKVKQAEPDPKVLHAKISQLTLEIDFLEGALT